MRSESEMLRLLTNAAARDDRIRAAWLEGSRCNPNAPKDIFQDYDVAFVVGDTKPFREDKRWIHQFGEILYMQYPEENVFYQEENDPEQSYGWLVQFADGVRLDLHVCTLKEQKPALWQNRMYRVLLDKDNCLPPPGEGGPSDREFWVKRPGEREFSCTCNEFWWCMNNVAKGLWRNEIPYVMDMLGDPIRPQLLRLIGWKIGIQTGFSVSIGKSGKYMHRWLTAEMYQRYLNTYSDAQKHNIWKSVYAMCGLADEIAAEISQKLGLPYDAQEAKNSRAHLERVQRLPRDAKGVY